MPYWSDRAGAAANLRLLIPGEGWRAYSDKVDGEQQVEAAGSKRLIESAFLNALNATNLVVLTGTGSSFAVKNPAAKLTPAGMADIWTAVYDNVGKERFDKVCGLFASATIDDNIERLLTLCKLYLELNEKAEDDEFKLVQRFVIDAEEAILKRVDFVDRDTNLDAHSALIQKLGRRGIRKSRSKLFTTNYDLCFEEAARRHRFTAIDGSRTRWTRSMTGLTSTMTSSGGTPPRTRLTTSRMSFSSTSCTARSTGVGSAERSSGRRGRTAIPS